MTQIPSDDVLTGIAVGAGVIFILLFILLIWLCYTTRSSKQVKEIHEKTSADASEAGSPLLEDNPDDILDEKGESKKRFSSPVYIQEIHNNKIFAKQRSRNSVEQAEHTVKAVLLDEGGNITKLWPDDETEDEKYINGESGEKKIIEQTASNEDISNSIKDDLEEDKTDSTIDVKKAQSDIVNANESFTNTDNIEDKKALNEIMKEDTTKSQDILENKSIEDSQTDNSTQNQFIGDSTSTDNSSYFDLKKDGIVKIGHDLIEEQIGNEQTHALENPKELLESNIEEYLTTDTCINGVDSIKEEPNINVDEDKEIDPKHANGDMLTEECHAKGGNISEHKDDSTKIKIGPNGALNKEITGDYHENQETADVKDTNQKFEN